MSPYNLFPGHSHQIVPRRSRARQTPRKSPGTKHGDGHTVIRAPNCNVMVPGHMTNSVRDNNAWSNEDMAWKAFWEILTICPFLFIIGIVSQHSTVNFCFHFVKPNIGILEFVPGRMGAEGVTSDGSNINIMGVNKQRPGRADSYPLSSL